MLGSAAHRYGAGVVVVVSSFPMERQCRLKSRGSSQVLVLGFWLVSIESSASLRDHSWHRRQLGFRCCVLVSYMDWNFPLRP